PVGDRRWRRWPAGRWRRLGRWLRRQRRRLLGRAPLLGGPYPHFLITQEIHHGEAACAQAEEEGLRILQGQGHVRGLQGHEHAAEVHFRPRQDPCPPRDRQLHAAPA